MAKGDASKFRKSIKGRMTKKEQGKYQQMLTWETPGFAEAKRKLMAKMAKARAPAMEMSLTTAQQRELEANDQNVRGGYQPVRSEFKKEVRGVELSKFVPKYEKSVPKPIEEIDPTDINVKRDAKAFGTFKPEFIAQTSQGISNEVGLAPDLVITEGDDNFMGTTGGEAWVYDDVMGMNRHPNPLIGKLLNEQNIIGKTIDRGNAPMSAPRSWEGTKKGGMSRKQDFKKMEKQKTTNSLQKVLSVRGRVGKTEEELQQFEPHPQRHPNYGGRNKAERQFPNIPILKSGEHMGNMGYTKDPKHELLADLRIKQGAFSRGECGANDSTCSEFYLLKDPSYEKITTHFRGNTPKYVADTYTLGKKDAIQNRAPNTTGDITEAVGREVIADYEGRRGKTPLENFYNKPHMIRERQIAKPSELDYSGSGRETMTLGNEPISYPVVSDEKKFIKRGKQLGGRIEGMQDTTPQPSVELDIKRSFGGKGGRTLGTNELEVKEGMSYGKANLDYGVKDPRRYTQEGVKPIKELNLGSLRRLARNKGIPVREKKVDEFDPDLLKKPALRGKMVKGLPVDANYSDSTPLIEDDPKQSKAKKYGVLSRNIATMANNSLFIRRADPASFGGDSGGETSDDGMEDGEDSTFLRDYAGGGY